MRLHHLNVAYLRQLGDTEEHCQAVQVVRLTAHLQQLCKDLLLGPGGTEDSRQLLEVGESGNSN